MSRKQTRSTDDEIGRRLVQAGTTLLRTATPIEELTIADVLQLIEVEDGRRWTSGVVYPRFGTLEGLRYAVLVQMIKDGPHHRDAALNRMGSHLLGFPEDGSVDFDEPAEGEVKVKPTDVAEMIETVASEQQRLMRRDPEVAFRQYARARIELGDDDQTQELRETLHEDETRTSEAWVHLLEGFCRDLNLRPAGAEDELTIKDFETALSCLLDGMAVRQKIEPLRDGLYARLVMALAIGFLETDDGTPRKSMKDHLVQHMRRGERKLVTTRKRFIDLKKAKAEVDGSTPPPPPPTAPQLRPAVARALAPAATKD